MGYTECEASPLTSRCVIEIDRDERSTRDLPRLGRIRFVAAVLTISGSLVTDVSAQPDAAQLSGYVTLTSDYRNRGLSQSSGRGALQLGLDYQHPRGFFLGGWASTVDFGNEPGLEERRGTELDYYLGYDWQLDDWGATITLARYTYPGGPSVYEYSEGSGTIRYRDRVYLTSSRTSDSGFGQISISTHELALVLPLRWNVELGATLGRTELNEVPDSRYRHWNVGVSKPVGSLSVDLRFHDNTYGISTYLGEARPDSWVLSVSYGFLAR